MKKIFNNLAIATGLTLMLFTASCTQDPCAKLTCQNGGTCTNGECACPEGWSGSDCATQKTPTKIKISKIEVLDFKATDPNGAGWD
jgi:EGF-like domain